MRTILPFYLFLAVLTCACRQTTSSQESQARPEAFHISSEEGKTWNVLGVEITGKVLSEETQGAYSVILTETPPDGGPPMHLHQYEDELFYVLKGSYAFYYGDKQILAQQGDFIHLPRGIPHRFVNRDSVTGITMNTITPGGFERFFEDIAKVSGTNRPSREVIDSIANRYGVTFVN
ncbi:MAG: cupin domain-containing protein [Bacteroidota bacterium]